MNLSTLSSASTILFVVALAVAITCLGCSDASPTDKNNANHFFASGIGGSSSNDLVGMFTAYNHTTDLIDGGSPVHFEQTTLQAQFLDSNGVFPVSAGQVEFNSTALDDLDDSAMYAYFLDGPTLSFSGGMNYFDIGGSADFPALYDSVASPITETDVTSPVVGDTVSKLTGFTLLWTMGTADTVEITLTPNWPVSGPVKSVLVPNTGSFAITTGDMGAWPLGPLTVTVSRINFVRRTIPGTNRDVLYTVQSEHEVHYWVDN